MGVHEGGGDMTTTRNIILTKWQIVDLVLLTLLAIAFMVAVVYFCIELWRFMGHFL
jgi:hypothetical protein